jgi:hypothetical protein
LTSLECTELFIFTFHALIVHFWMGHEEVSV